MHSLIEAATGAANALVTVSVLNAGQSGIFVPAEVSDFAYEAIGAAGRLATSVVDGASGSVAGSLASVNTSVGSLASS